MKELATPFPAHWPRPAGARRLPRRERLHRRGLRGSGGTDASFFGIPFKVPNTKRHRWGDPPARSSSRRIGLRHRFPGEGEISAWELRSGLWNLGLYVGGIVALGTLAGVAFAPRRALAAWRRAKGLRSLFTLGPASGAAAYEELLSLDRGRAPRVARHDGRRPCERAAQAPRLRP